MSSETLVKHSDTEAESMMASALLKIRSEAMYSNLHSGDTTTVYSPIFPAVRGMASAQQYAALQIAAATGPYTVPFSNLISLLPQSGPTVDGFEQLGGLLHQNVGVRNNLASLVESTLGKSAECRKPDERSKEEIRLEEIDAAFQSRPQRGRKRDNLNEMERLELTRTRNRMHAQSTRMRKKARYQELLEKEAKLRPIESVENLQQNRRQTILQFLAARELMLRPSSTPPSTGEGSAYDSEQVQGSFASMVVSMHSFVFRTDIADTSSDCLQQMRNFDNAVRSKAAVFYGGSDCSSLAYRFDRSGRHIALDLENLGFLEVSIGLLTQSASLLSALLKFAFEPNSPRLTTVRWTTLKDSSDHDHDEPLIVRSSHPSVVSLDPVVSDLKDSAESSAANDHEVEDHGLGMDY